MTTEPDIRIEELDFNDPRADQLPFDETECDARCGTIIGPHLSPDPETGHDIPRWTPVFLVEDTQTQTPTRRHFCEDCVADPVPGDLFTHRWYSADVYTDPTTKAPFEIIHVQKGPDGLIVRYGPLNWKYSRHGPPPAARRSATIPQFLLHELGSWGY